MTKKKDSKPHLLWCKVVIEEGQARATYRWSDTIVNGRHDHDEDVSSWTDDEVVNLIADMIGADERDREKIEIEW